MHRLVCFQTLQYLQQNAKERAELAASAAGSSATTFSAPATASKISMQELEELRKQLGSVATGSTLQQVLLPHSPGPQEQTTGQEGSDPQAVGLACCLLMGWPCGLQAPQQHPARV